MRDLPPMYLSPIEEAEALALIQRIRTALPPHDVAVALAAIGEMIADGEITDEPSYLTPSKTC